MRFFLSAHGFVRKNGRLGDPALPSLSFTGCNFLRARAMKSIHMRKQRKFEQKLTKETKLQKIDVIESLFVTFAIFCADPNRSFTSQAVHPRGRKYTEGHKDRRGRCTLTTSASEEKFSYFSYFVSFVNFC
jgi:hypothetical protein